MKRTVIIVAGGSGSRFGAELPKQYVELGGIPIFIRSIQRFLEVYPAIHIILVVPAESHAQARGFLASYSLAERVQTTDGGASRYHSVKRGLALADRTGVIAVHDAVRPLVSKKVIKDCFDTSTAEGSAIPVLSMENSIRKITSDGNEALDRSAYRIVQTPQCFQAEWIHEAYDQQKKASFTDDASVVESANFPIFLVEGNKENIKITTPTDLLVANAFLTLID